MVKRLGALIASGRLSTFKQRNKTVSLNKLEAPNTQRVGRIIAVVNVVKFNRDLLALPEGVLATFDELPLHAFYVDNQDIFAYVILGKHF